MGPYVLGTVESLTGSFEGGLLFLGASMSLGTVTVLRLGLGKRGNPQ
jgi:MFS transporter, ACS family, tartrate transporter